MTKLDFLKTLPKRELIYIIYSRLTNLPYAECNGESFEDEVFLFTEEADALERAKALTQAKCPAVAVKAEQKDMLKLFADLYVYGVTGLVVAVGKDLLRIPLSEIVRRPKISNLPENARPLENPALQLSMMYYLQEARKPSGIEAENADKAAELEEEMAVNLIRARYLLPIKEVELDGKKATQLLMMRTKAGEVMVPIFSDGVEYGRFKRDQELKAAVTDFEKLAGMPLPDEVKGFMLNPGGAGLVLTKEYLRKELQLNR
ncbi:MAG: SseB family protein [Lachnospiraceae bacterium]|nr:SseB family protein [Lachnospiraceae bacterium]